MTNQERLEEIKEQYQWTVENSLVPRLEDSDIEYLIQQAEEKVQLEECVKELEGRLKVSKANNDILKHEIEESEGLYTSSIQINRLLRNENQRYKQALERIMDYGIRGKILGHIDSHVSSIARQALQGDNDG